MKSWLDSAACTDSLICKRQGLAKPNQIPACKKEIGKAASFIFNRPVSADMLLRNAIFAHNIAKTMTDSNPDIQVGAYSNRKLINSGLASATAAQTWMPTIKATMTAIVISLMPFLLLLLSRPNDALYQASTDSLKGIVSVTHQNNTHANLGVGASGGIGIKAHGDIGKTWSDQTVTDALYGNFSSLGKALQVEAISQNIDIKDQPHWIADHYAKASAEVQAYYTQDATKDSVSVSSAWEAVKEMPGKVKNLDLSATNPIQQYLKNQKLDKAQEAFKTGVATPKPPGGGK